MTNQSEGAGAAEASRIQTVFREAGDLIKRLEGSSVSRLALEVDGYKIEIERGGFAAAPVAMPGPMITGAPAAMGAPSGAGAAPAEGQDGRIPVLAPLLGTFYRSPQPGAKAFVEVGDVVDQGQTVCIVEAMKIMNQISAEQRGRVAEILAKDGDWVEFHQVLMYLEPIE
jgi:acetyl-CoA carboxylase biotin carboxyl carrier protein